MCVFGEPVPALDDCDLLTLDDEDEDEDLDDEDSFVRVLLIVIFIPSELGFTMYSEFLFSPTLLLVFLVSVSLLEAEPLRPSRLPDLLPLVPLPLPLLPPPPDCGILPPLPPPSLSLPQCCADFNLSITADRDPLRLRTWLSDDDLLRSIVPEEGEGKLSPL